jgi:hypothetical protein
VSISSFVKEQRMKARSVLIAVFFLGVVPYSTVAQAVRKGGDEPPQLEKILAGRTSQPNEVLAGLSAIDAQIPLGPLDVLKEYERDMALIAQRMSAELVSISQAGEANQITREQAEYLIQQRYQVATMQEQVLSALHETLEHDVAQAATLVGRPRLSDTTVVVAMPSSGPSAGCK